MSQQLPKLLIGTPMYGGLATGTYIESLLSLTNELRAHGIKYGVTFTYNESLITRARNRISDEFLKATDSTHLLWVDADIGFNAQDILAWLALDKDIIGAACVKKSLDWDRIKYVIRANGHDPSAAELMAMSGDFVVHFLPGQEQQLKINEPKEVRRLGTGLLMVKREVFLKMKKKYPNRFYNGRGDVAARLGPIHAFFESRVDPETREYLSEDYAFCDDARELGFSVWLAPWAKTSHTGAFKFQGDLGAVALSAGSL